MSFQKAIAWYNFYDKLNGCVKCICVSSAGESENEVQADIHPWRSTGHRVWRDRQVPSSGKMGSFIDV